MDTKDMIFDRYQKFLDKTTKLATSLERLHDQHMQCRMGCSFCCMDYSLFPVEYYSMLRNLKKTEVRINGNAAENECVFLVNNACMIYAFRPMICRTHGLPLLYTNDEGEWELSACELNFIHFEEEFHPDNTFPQDRFNSKLFMLNREFVALEEFSHFSEFDLIPLRNLGEELM